jgi:hypothetical protein
MTGVRAIFLPWFYDFESDCVRDHIRARSGKIEIISRGSPGAR